MEYYAPECYFSFRCIGGECPSTCCAGWRILVAKEDYMRFAGMEPLSMREDILTHIDERDGKYFFQTDMDGRCSMLDEDGLCRIQRNTSEKTLCNTCRKYPRLLRQYGESLGLSMAASCPVVSDWLIKDKVRYFQVTEGRKKEISARDIPFSTAVWKIYEQNSLRAEEYSNKISIWELVQSSVAGLLDELTDVLLDSRERISREILAILEMYGTEEDFAESDIVQRWKLFLTYEREEWYNLRENYLAYRIPGRRITAGEERWEETFCQVMGELFLLRIFRFIYYDRDGRLTEEQTGVLVRKMYRLCAHGERLSGEIHRIFCDFYQEKSLWNLVVSCFIK